MFPTLSSSSLLCFLCLLVFLPCCPSITDDILYQLCGEANYTANGSYDSNLNLLLPSLAGNASLSGGYFDALIGQAPDQVYGLALCRGDTNATLCLSCLNNASDNIVHLCPYKVEAVIWYDRCLLRYSNQWSLATTKESQWIIMYNVNNITDPSLFEKLVSELLSALAHWATYNTTARFATGEVNFTTDFPTIYGLVQCTPDQWDSLCWKCLREILDSMPTVYQGKQGARVLRVYCNFRYEVYKFYDGASTLRLGSPSPAPAPALLVPPVVNPAGEKGNKKNVRDMVLKIAIPVVSSSLLISITCFCFWTRRKPAKNLLSKANSGKTDEAHLEEVTHVESLLLDLSMLRAATNNFSEENKLGQGGFGAVYKGTLPNGQELAVKRLSTTSKQGVAELKNELILVANLQHKNLVTLLGICLEEQEKLLVYEYVPNRSLDTILFDPTKREQLLWKERYKIIKGTARGLLYLHEDSQLKIIHRDLKAGNILLDANMNPKISDFGLARLFDGDQSHSITNRVVGTFGYMAPEYVMHGQLSLKSDVYSYGVLVLEIITGRKNSTFFDSTSGKYLLALIWEKWNKGTILDIVDSCLRNDYPKIEVLKCIQIGLLCVQENSSNRPDMSAVIMMLNNNFVPIQAATQPAFCIGQFDLCGGVRNQSLERLILMTPNEMSITEVDPR